MKSSNIVSESAEFFQQQFFTSCLAEMAYYIESSGEAVVVDPMRDTSQYVELATSRGATIKYVFLTHFHADFVSGHLELAEQTKATIILGPTAQPKFPAKIALDGETISLGKIMLKVLHTPGHTPESSCLLLKDSNNKDVALYTGDTIFLGDVGRPDLAASGLGVTSLDLAGWLYDSIKSKTSELPDEIIVYPGHGAGSACGKNISQGTSDTLGNQRKSNVYLQGCLSRAEFITILTADISSPPQYFPHDVGMNKNGCALLSTVMENANKPLTSERVNSLLKSGSLLLDCRSSAKFLDSHIPGSLSVNIDMPFASYVGTLVAPGTSLVLVIQPDREIEVITRLARIGYDSIEGYLEGGIETYVKDGNQVASIETISPEKFIHQMVMGAPQHTAVDVRNPSEYAHEHLHNALNLPLPKLPQILDNQETQGLTKDQRFYVYCKGGNRSTAACSILKAHGYHNIVNINGGIGQLVEVGVPVFKADSQSAFLPPCQLKSV